jgi:hypothetical protein
MSGAKSGQRLGAGKQPAAKRPPSLQERMDACCHASKSVTMATMTRQQFLRTLSASAIGFADRRAPAQPAAPEDVHL